ncbi:MAG: DEAD/DEAH box helicase [Pseudomonadota bacterium]|nr:DEAD/DEAH box helicase [Pseudomonadota bacterium]
MATPIQAAAIPVLLEGGDVLGLAQTGTGKTAAFLLPILHGLLAENKRPSAKRPRALILAPTRELALQIVQALKTLGRFTRLRFLAVVGGVGFRPQINALAAGTDVVVATPGRLEDLMGSGAADLSEVTHLVLDEADRMLDIGFAPAIRRIVAKIPAQRHSALFSATMPKTVDSLARDLLRSPTRIEISPTSTTAEQVEQRVYHTGQTDKRALLKELLADPEMNRVIVFVRTKHAADRLAEQLTRDVSPAEAIHGDRGHSQRIRALDRFKRGHARLLVATDIAARGIDVDEVSHVVNYDMPRDAESYVHRIGRTARAGRSGVAISFCAPADRDVLRDIERTTRQRLTVVGDTPPEALREGRGGRGKPGRGRNGGGGGYRGDNAQGNGEQRGAASRNGHSRGRGQAPRAPREDGQPAYASWGTRNRDGSRRV